jgi:hypothetical protein
MTFKNYKIHNYTYNHPLSAEDLNSLVSNDIILNNKIEAMPRGVLGFAQINPYSTTRQTFTQPSGASDPDTDREAFNYQYVLINPAAGSPTPLEVSFTVEQNRLIKFTGYLANLRTQSGSGGTTLTKQAIVRTAFLLKNYKDEWSLLSSPAKSNRIYHAGNIGSWTFSCVEDLPAGQYSVRLGVKVHNTNGIYLGEDSSASLTNQSNGIISKRATQLIVEDIGSFLSSEAEVDYEFQE